MPASIDDGRLSLENRLRMAAKILATGAIRSAALAAAEIDVRPGDSQGASNEEREPQDSED